MSKIIPFREEIFHQINQILESQKAFIFYGEKVVVVKVYCCKVSAEK